MVLSWKHVYFCCTDAKCVNEYCKSHTRASSGCQLCDRLHCVHYTTISRCARDENHRALGIECWQANAKEGERNDYTIVSNVKKKREIKNICP